MARMGMGSMQRPRLSLDRLSNQVGRPAAAATPCCRHAPCCRPKMLLGPGERFGAGSRRGAAPLPLETGAGMAGLTSTTTRGRRRPQQVLLQLRLQRLLPFLLWPGPRSGWNMTPPAARSSRAQARLDCSARSRGVLLAACCDYYSVCYNQQCTMGWVL